MVETKLQNMMVLPQFICFGCVLNFGYHQTKILKEEPKMRQAYKPKYCLLKYRGSIFLGRGTEPDIESQFIF